MRLARRVGGRGPAPAIEPLRQLFLDAAAAVVPTSSETVTSATAVGLLGAVGVLEVGLGENHPEEGRRHDDRGRQ
jgi:hypothetical protein